MKPTLALQQRRRLNRSEAWGCFTANLSLPGSGSLSAGRAIGYAQLALATLGFVVFTVACLRFLFWYLKNWERIFGAGADPLANFEVIGKALKGPLIGGAVIVLALLWAMITSLEILRAAPKDDRSLPPRLR